MGDADGGNPKDTNSSQYSLDEPQSSNCGHEMRIHQRKEKLENQKYLQKSPEKNNSLFKLGQKRSTEITHFVCMSNENVSGSLVHLWSCGKISAVLSIQFQINRILNFAIYHRLEEDILWSTGSILNSYCSFLLRHTDGHKKEQ